MVGHDGVVNVSLIGFATHAQAPITFNNLTITAPSNSPNTDAIDPAGNNTLFYNSSE